MISSGRLRHTIEFYSVTTVKNEYNESIESLTYQFSTKSEQLQSETETSINSNGTDIAGVASFRVRYNQKIKTNMVIRFNGEDFQITNIDNRFGKNRELNIDAINYIQD